MNYSSSAKRPEGPTPADTCTVEHFTNAETHAKICMKVEGVKVDSWIELTEQSGPCDSVQLTLTPARRALPNR